MKGLCGTLPVRGIQEKYKNVSACNRRVVEADLDKGADLVLGWR